MSAQQLKIYEHFGEARVDQIVPPPGSTGITQQQNTIISTITTATATTSIYSSSGSTAPAPPPPQQQLKERIAQAQGVPDDIVSFEQLFTAITANCDKPFNLFLKSQKPS